MLSVKISQQSQFNSNFLQTFSASDVNGIQMESKSECMLYYVLMGILWGRLLSVCEIRFRALSLHPCLLCCFLLNAMMVKALAL